MQCCVSRRCIEKMGLSGSKNDRRTAMNPRKIREEWLVRDKGI